MGYLLEEIKLMNIALFSDNDHKIVYLYYKLIKNIALLLGKKRELNWHQDNTNLNNIVKQPSCKKNIEHIALFSLEFLMVYLLISVTAYQHAIIVSNPPPRK